METSKLTSPKLTASQAQQSRVRMFNSIWKACSLTSLISQASRSTLSGTKLLSTQTTSLAPRLINLAIAMWTTLLGTSPPSPQLETMLPGSDSTISLTPKLSLAVFRPASVLFEQLIPERWRKALFKIKKVLKALGSDSKLAQAFFQRVLKLSQLQHES